MEKNSMHDGDDHDDVDDFRQAVQHNVLLLKGAPNEAMRRKAATSILECIKHGVLSENNNTSKLNSVREAFSMLLAELGPGDEQILESILGLLLASAVKADMRQLLLDLLPAVVITVADTEAVFETVKAVQEKDTTALLPILCSLSQLPLADEERKQVFLLAVGALSTVSEQELPSLVRAILRHVSCTSEAVSAWIALRYEWQLKEQQHHDNDSDVDWSQRVAHIVVASFAESNGEILAASFVKLLEELKLDTADNCHEGDDCILVLDLIVLLTLSVQLQYTDTANRIVDSWLRRHVFPFTLLDAVLRQMLPTQHQNQLNQRLTQALLRLSVFLLLAPARATSVSLSIESLVHAFVLNLQHRLDCERQAELVHSLLHLSEETAVSWRGTNSATTTGRRKRKLPAVNELNALTIVHQSVNTLLQRFAETAPNTLIRFKHILTGRLTSTTYSCDSQSICSILTSLMQSDCLEISELMVLLQKLLFSGSVRGDSSRVVRGIMLATELIRCCADRECIQEWVLRLLLPATRRTVDPELGSPGLAFLKALRKLEKNDSKNDIFQHFKLILANTGLIQMLANYQMSKDDDAILGYSKLPFYFQSTAVKSRSMLFCVNFFLRHMDTADARRWPYVTQWVFELVDTYLCMGREKANKWRPDGWLLASVEFPTIFLPFDESVVNQKAVVDWMKRILCHFELTEEIQGKCAGLTDYAETIVHNLEIRQLRQFLESVYRFSLSLLVGVVLSAAVLKNAFEHLRAVQIGENAYKSANAGDLLRLVKLQVIKIYDLRTKSKVIEALLFALESSIRRSLFRKKRAAVGVSDDLSDISIEEVVDTEHSIERKRMLSGIDSVLSQTRSLQKSIFTSQENIGIDVLWKCLIDPIDDEAMRGCLNTLALVTKSASCDSVLVDFRLIFLKFNLLLHIISLVANPSTIAGETFVTQEQLVHCLNETCFLLDILPTLRTGYFALEAEKGVAYESNSRLSLSHVVLLATSYVRLLVLILQKVSCNRLIKAKGDFPPEPLTFDDCIQWCIRCPSISRTHEVTTGSTESASPVTRLFEFFSERLRLSDNSTVADHILEVLSILALQENGVLMEKLLDLSWVSLHTIYVHTGTEAEQGSLPCALSESVIRFGQQVSSSDLQSLRCVVERTVDKLYYNGIDTIKGLHHLRQGMLRHWGLVTASPTGHSLQRNQLASMIAELASLLESLSNSIRRKNEEEKKESETSTSHKRKKALPPSIIGLDAATFPDFYKLLTHVVVAATATLTPVLPQGPGCSPYNHIKESFALFRRLIELYRRHIAIFPRKTAATVSNVSKDMLSVAVSLLQRCVEWRNSQPLLSVRDREAGKHDPGAIRFLEQFIGTAASHTAGTILNLCDFLQSHEAAHVSRSTTLRFAAEKAARRIKDVSISHNLAPPSFIAGFENFESDQYSMQQTKGFHQLEPVNGPKEKQHVCPLFVNSEMGDESRRLQRDRSRLQKDDIVLDEKAGNESEDSFGAAGDWGDDSDEDSESSLNLHPNSPFLKM